MTTEYEPGQKIKAVYRTSVYKPNIGGWRSERVYAELEVISPGRAKVIRANLEPAMSNRQRFSVSNAAAKEKGKIKIISKLDSVELIDYTPTGLREVAEWNLKAEGFRSLQDRIELEGADMNSAYPKVIE